MQLIWYYSPLWLSWHIPYDWSMADLASYSFQGSEQQFINIYSWSHIPSIMAS